MTGDPPPGRCHSCGTPQSVPDTLVWPPPGGGCDWEGGTTVDGQRWEHVPHLGWRPVHADPFLGTIYRDPRTRRHRSRLSRWLDRRRHGIVVAAVLATVVGYTTTIVGVFDQTLPTIRTAGILVTVAVLLVGVLLSVILWARRD